MLIAEFKKLFRPMYLLVALLITVVFYNQDMSFIFNYWPNGGMVPIYDQAEEWQNRFGPTLENEEIAEIEAEYMILMKQANQIVAENTIAKELQLGNYSEYESWVRENFPGVATNELNEAEREIVKQNESIQQDLIDDMGQEMVNKIDVLQELIYAMGRFNSPNRFLNDEYYTGKEKEGLLETLFKEEGWRNIMPSYLPSHIALYFERILVLFIFLASLLIPSVFVKDRLVGIQKNQWSSRHGRNILWTQFLVGMTASFFLITCIVGVFGGLLYSTDFVKYFPNGLNSFFTDNEEPLLYSFYTWTFDQWRIRLVLLVYIIGMAYSGVLLFLSQTSRHYLSLLLKMIPVAFLFIVIANLVFKEAFYLENNLYQWTKMPMIELYAGILLFVIGISLPVIYCIRQRNKDLMN